MRPSGARKSAYIAIVAFLGLAAAGRAHAARYTLWASDEFEKIKPQPLGASYYVTPTYLWTTTATDSTITLYGARDEWVACQLAIHAIDNLSNVDVVASNLILGGHKIPADSIRLYLEHEMFIRSHNPRQPGKADSIYAYYRDALIPFRDPYTPGGPRVAGRFSVAGTQNRVVWIDIHVPSNAPAGLYQGDLTVLEGASAPRRVHVKMNVWNFTIPERSGLDAWVGLHPEYFSPGEEVDPSYGGLNAESWSVLRQYELMAHEHRFTIAHKNMVPDADFDPVTGALLSVDWTRYDQYLGPVIDGSLFPDHVPPNVWMLPIRVDFRVPFGGPADSLAVKQWTAEVANHFLAKGWPLDKSFAWVYDEPRIDTSINFPTELIHYASAMRAGSPLVNILLTDAIEDSAMIGSVDWYCSKGDKYYPPEMDAMKSTGRIKRKMFYQSYAEPALPVETIDVRGLAWRVWPWIAWQYKVDGLLYWASNYWNVAAPYDSADGQSESYNDGEGTFFYPGAKLDTKGYPEIPGPVASFRMKALRRGLEDYAYLERLKAKGQSARADSIVNAMVVSALCATHASAPIYRGGITRYQGPFVDDRWRFDHVSEWKQTGADWFNARVFLGSRLSVIGEDDLHVWVLAPNGDEAWDNGSTQHITWQTSGGTGTIAIDIFLSRNGGTSFSDTLAIGESNDGSFTWPVTGTAGDSLWCVIRARASGETAVDVSDRPFRVTDGDPPLGQLLAPNGGELWITATPETIRWSAAGGDPAVSIDLDLSMDGGTSYPIRIASHTFNDGRHVWVVPDTVPETNAAMVRMTPIDSSGAMTSDASNDTFLIEKPFTVRVVVPNGGESWNLGTSQNIRWITTGGGDSVSISIFLSHDGGITLPETLAVGQPDDGVFTWNVTGDVGERRTCVVKACSRGTCKSDPGNGLFTAIDTMAPLVSVIQPNGGDIWNVASPETIRWTATDGDSVTSVNFQLSTDGGATFPLTIAAGQPNDGVAVWTLPPSVTMTPNARIRVTARDPSSHTGQDNGDSNFNVQSPLPDLEVSLRLLQNPVLTRFTDVYAITSKEIRDTSLHVTVAGTPVVMAPSDTSRNTWRGMAALPASGPVGLTGCARDLALYQDCETRTVQVTLVPRLTGGIARTVTTDASLSIPPLALAEDVYVVMGRESVAAGGGPEAWSGAQFAAIYEIGPDGRSLSRSATLRVKTLVFHSYVGLAREVGGVWTPVSSYYDSGTHEIVASVNQMGRYALVTSQSTDLSSPLPVATRLQDNRPNPFNPRTVIRYVLAQPDFVALRIYDATGRLVRTLVEDNEDLGDHEVTWNGTDDHGDQVPSGVYLYRLESGGTAETRKMVLLK